MYHYAIYFNTSDYPDKFVARLWIIDSGTMMAGPLICVVDTLEEARQSLPDGLEKITRLIDDDPVLVEVWI